MVGCGAVGKSQLIFFDNVCEIKGREPKQHDPMIMSWRYTSCAREPLDPLPQRSSQSAQRRWPKQSEPQPVPPSIPSITDQMFIDSTSEEHSGAQEHADANMEAQEDAHEEADYMDIDEIENNADIDDATDEIRSIGFALANSAALLPNLLCPMELTIS